jgi:hypothetical protein
MNAAHAQAEQEERNRREAYRINDRIALAVTALSETEYRRARDRARGDQERGRLLNSIIATGEGMRGALRNIRDVDPAVAAYLQSLEERLDSLARMLAREGSGVSDHPTHDVNISGNGIRFVHDEPLTTGSRVELQLQLFPSRDCLRLLGTVVRVNKRSAAARGPGRYVVAVDFTDIHDDDRELLIRHVHCLQLDYVRRGALRD